ncbi:hypothetical protein [Sphingomonas sp.]|uniref:hypothetical protein n=1 Tax=Sphingomonas sp. TaxID=28214 RepID=UPI003AFFE2A7
MLELARSARQSVQDVSALTTTFRSFHAGRAANVWRHIFFAAIAKDEKLLDYLAMARSPTSFERIRAAHASPTENSCASPPTRRADSGAHTG